MSLTLRTDLGPRPLRQRPASPGSRPTESTDARLELIWSEALRAIESQHRVIDEMRQRAANLLTAASIGAGFLGEAALNDDHGDWLGPAGVACFAIVAGLTAFVLWPRTFTSILSPRTLLADCVESDTDWSVDQMRWSISKELEGYYDDNQESVGWFARAIGASCLFLAGEILAWLLEIGG